MSEPAREWIPENEPVPQPAPDAQLSMIWHGFLVRIMLWIAAAWHIFEAIWILLGRIYFEPAVREAVYSAMPALRILDYALAAALIAAAALQILARSGLKNRRVLGIRRLRTAYIVLIAAIAIYLAGRWAIAGMPPVSISLLGRLAACIALLLVNRSYYLKRRGLFAAESKGV